MDHEFNCANCRYGTPGKFIDTGWVICKYGPPPTMSENHEGRWPRVHPAEFCFRWVHKEHPGRSIDAR